MKEKIIQLKPEELLKFSQSFEMLTFNNDFDLVYENQVPTAGILLLEGNIDLISNSKVVMKIHPGQLLGVTHLLNEQAVTYGCRVKANSKIILLGKSDILTYVKNKKSDLFPILKAAR